MTSRFEHYDAISYVFHAQLQSLEHAPSKVQASIEIFAIADWTALPRIRRAWNPEAIRDTPGLKEALRTDNGIANGELIRRRTELVLHLPSSDEGTDWATSGCNSDVRYSHRIPA
jgi:hypothetical protein